MEDTDCWESKFELCEYSNILLAKLEQLNLNSLNKVDIKTVKKPYTMLENIMDLKCDKTGNLIIHTLWK